MHETKCSTPNCKYRYAYTEEMVCDVAALQAVPRTDRAATVPTLDDAPSNGSLTAGPVVCDQAALLR